MSGCRGFLYAIRYNGRKQWKIKNWRARKAILWKERINMIAFFIFGTGLICFGIGYYAGRKEERKVSLPLLGKYKKLTDEQEIAMHKMYEYIEEHMREEVRKAVEERECGNDIGK